jgi:hypothetical protein
VLVADSDQFHLPGVTVTLSGSALEKEYIGVTNAQGQFRFVKLPFGSYDITFELTGFKTLISKNVSISSEPKTLKVSLEFAYVEEPITVGPASPNVDISRYEGHLLTGTSTFLRNRIDKTQSQFKKTNQPGIQLRILTDASRYWWNSLAGTQNRLLVSAESPEKRKVIKQVFGDIYHHLMTPYRNVQNSTSPQFGQQAEIFMKESSVAADAMALIAGSRRLAFDLEAKSDPQNAKVSYWLAYTKPIEHHERTNTIIENLAFAIWYLKFELEGYCTEEITYDVFTDTSHVVSVKLKKKKLSFLRKPKK